MKKIIVLCIIVGVAIAGFVYYRKHDTVSQQQPLQVQNQQVGEKSNQPQSSSDESEVKPTNPGVTAQDTPQ